MKQHHFMVQKQNSINNPLFRTLFSESQVAFGSVVFLLRLILVCRKFRLGSIAG
jgi:hypothetical protein